MTGDAQPRRDTLRRQRDEMQAALDATIEDTIREAWLPNTLAWIVTVGAAFLINIGLLLLLAGSR
jgi:hypothetical protein